MNKTKTSTQKLENGQAGGSNTLPHDQKHPNPVNVDWFTCSFPVTTNAYVKRLVEPLMTLFTDTMVYKIGEPRTVVMNRYASHGKSTCGISLEWSTEDTETNTRGKGRLTIPGAAIARIEQAEFLKILVTLKTVWHAECSRIDIALNDRTGELSYADIKHAADNGMFKGFKKAPQTTETVDRGVLKSWTISFGSRESRKFVRIYDKAGQLLHKGDSAVCEGQSHLHWVRVETELKHDIANQAFNRIALMVEELGTSLEAQILIAFQLSSYVFDSIDFVDNSTGKFDSSGNEKRKRNTRSERLDWWESFRKSMGSLSFGEDRHKLTRPRPKPSIQRKVKWMSEKVGTSFTILERIYGLEETIRLLRQDPSMLSRENKALIRTTRLEIDKGIAERTLIGQYMNYCSELSATKKLIGL